MGGINKGCKEPSRSYLHSNLLLEFVQSELFGDESTFPTGARWEYGSSSIIGVAVDGVEATILKPQALDVTDNTGCGSYASKLGDVISKT